MRKQDVKKRPSAESWRKTGNKPADCKLGQAVTIERYRAEQNQTSLEDKGRKKEDDCIRPHQLKSTRPSRTELVREIRKQKGR